MASGWLLQTIYAALLGQTLVPTDLPPSPQPSTNPGDVLPNRPQVSTFYGEVQGFQKVAASGVTINTFLGIPFASPPVGNRRFEKPSPPSSWSGVRDASRVSNQCVQRQLSTNLEVIKKPVVKAEDCLYLNVYKPESKLSGSDSNIGSSGFPGSLLPVMVWIHGGAFIYGAGSQYDGSDLAANGGVILVTLNYRLDVFGFLSNEDDVIPGNYGLLDQVMALKWVKQNIKSFGGDPDKVTIFGQSAGSGSVSCLILSPLAKGLFSRAIMQSGSSLSPWGFQYPASRVTPSQMTNLIGAGVGCMDADATKKLECLRSVDAETLLNSTIAVGNALGLQLMLKPVVETKFGFLPDRPVNLWSQGKFNHVDTIRGYNKAERGFEVLSMSNYSLSTQEFVANVKEILTDYAIVDIDNLIQTIMQENDITPATDGHEILLKLTEVISDISFGGPTLVEANLESKMAPEKKRYVYQFDFKSDYSLTPSWMPAIHGEELAFVFGGSFGNRLPVRLTTKSPLSTNHRLMTKLIQIMWTNFAKYGSPVVTPPPPPSSSTGNPVTSSSTSGSLRWGPYVGDGAANVLRISINSQEVSFRNHSSARTFQKVLKRLDSSLLPERFIVGR